MGDVMDGNDNLAEMARVTMEELLDKLEIKGSVEIVAEDVAPGDPEEETPIGLEIKGEDLGVLIGRQGQTLASLQYIVRLITTARTGRYTPLVIDVEGYRKRRDASLRALALRIAEQVRTSRTPFKMEPMPAYERRIVHLALSDHPDVATNSTGEGELRRVVISLK
jgi:spoIIIJ-associated protein